MKQDKNNANTVKIQVYNWLVYHTEDFVCKTVKRYKGYEEKVKQAENVLGVLEDKNTEITNLKSTIGKAKAMLREKDKEIGKLKSVNESLKIENEELKSVICPEDSKVTKLEAANEKLESKVIELENSIDDRDGKISRLEAKISNASEELEILREKTVNIGKGKSHIRGTEEFYRDVKIACSLIVTKLNKNGKQYNDYREAVKYAKTCNTIVNYSSGNKVKINRENLRNWLSVAIAIQEGVEPKVAVGKYNASKGYKR